MTVPPDTTFRAERESRGFALVTVIVVMAALVLLALSLLILSDIERRTARAYSNKYRVELALDAATQAALAGLQPVTERDDFWVVSREVALEDGTLSSLPYLVFKDPNASSGWQFVPLAGGLQRETSGGVLPEMPAQAPEVEALVPPPANPLESTPSGQWEILDDSSPGGRELRFSYWMEDLHSRIDADYAGLEERNQGLTTRESGFFTLFEPTAIREPASGPHRDIMDNRDLLRQVRDFSVVLDDNGDANNPSTADTAQRYLNFGVPENLVEREIVPPYPSLQEPGVVQADLNELVNQGAVNQIAERILRHLPNFEQRRGGLAGDQSYSKTIAASIIDYADEDSDATVGEDYRGIDSYPFVNEIFDRYEWIDPPPGQPNVVRIQVRTFVELWNPSDIEVSGTIQLENVNRHRIIIPGIGQQEFGAVTYQPQSVTLGPNAYEVIECAPAGGPHTYSFQAGAFTPAPPLKFPSSWTTDSNYLLRWNGQLVDFARGGIARTDGTLRPGQPKWKGQGSVALDYRIGQNGDPRSSYLIQSWVYPNSYNRNTSWGGRSLKRGIGNGSYNEVRLAPSSQGNWPDVGHDTPAGAVAGSNSRLPTQLRLPAQDPDAAPAHISNSGNYASIGELGNIFDPAQWDNVNSAGGRPNANAGGGITLAIGRAEYPVFERDGLQARQLTDIFSIHPQAIRPVKGLINLNTAPREVLRSLWAGLFLDEDDALRRPVLPPQRSEAGDVFADAVILARSQRPLLGLADLLTLTDENGAFIFGERAAWTSRPPATDWDDEGREALFKRIANLVCFRSRAFRLVVASELVEPLGSGERVVARARREMSFALQPRRDPDGNPIPDEEAEFILIDRKL